MVIGNDNLGSLDVLKHVVRNDFTFVIISVRIVGLQNPESIFDGQAGGYYQKTSGEGFRRGMPRCVYSLPRDQHSHDGCFPSAGR